MCWINNSDMLSSNSDAKHFNLILFIKNFTKVKRWTMEWIIFSLFFSFLFQFLVITEHRLCVPKDVMSVSMSLGFPSICKHLALFFSWLATRLRITGTLFVVDFMYTRVLSVSTSILNYVLHVSYVKREICIPVSMSTFVSIRNQSASFFLFKEAQLLPFGSYAMFL